MATRPACGNRRSFYEVIARTHRIGREGRPGANAKVPQWMGPQPRFPVSLDRFGMAFALFPGKPSTSP
jgi:hypothetical protein